MIRYLEEGEKTRCRSLWEEAFPDDRGPFLDYYMERKVPGNRILVLEEQGEILSMLHRNPYEIKAGNRDWVCDYLVGVATAKKARRRGYMRQLMEKALSDMEEEGMPFCFLMPAHESLYTPFGFTYIYNQPQWVLNDRGRRLLEAVRVSEESEAEELSIWIESWLSRRFGVYAKPSREYVVTLMKEVASEKGYLECLYYKGDIAGVRGIWGGETREQRLLYTEEEFAAEREPPKKAIMGRIINMGKFLEAIHLEPGSGENSRSVRLDIQDPVLGKNSGSFQWILNSESSHLLSCNHKNVQNTHYLSAGIESLTGWLMGYSSLPETSFSEEGIRTLKNVFLDEVV